MIYDTLFFSGDRIAILSNGQVKCCGSSLFLKSKYGVGYHMVMVQEPGCNVARVSQVIQKYIPTAKLESNAGIGKRIMSLLIFSCLSTLW